MSDLRRVEIEIDCPDYENGILSLQLFGGAELDERRATGTLGVLNRGTHFVCDTDGWIHQYDDEGNEVNDE